MAKKTQKAIVDAFVLLLEQRSIDKITVLDVCEAGGISRSTFYYHYHDLYDLFEGLFRADVERMANACDSLEGLSDSSWRVCEFAVKNKQVVFHVYEGLSHEVLERYLFDAADLIAGRLVRAEATRFPGVTERDVYLTARVLSATLVGLSFDLLRRGLEDVSESSLAEYKRMVGDFIEYSFKGLAS